MSPDEAAHEEYPAVSEHHAEGEPHEGEPAEVSSHSDIAHEDVTHEPQREEDGDRTRAAYDAIELALGTGLFADEEPGEHPIPYSGISGYLPMQAKPDALQYQPALSVRFGRLPNKVDLRSLMPPVADQGDTGACVAHAVAGAYEYWIKKTTKLSRELSPLFVYYNARWRDGAAEHDTGSAIQLCLEALTKFGACSDIAWPVDARLVANRPGAEAYQDASPPRVQDFAQVPLRIHAWKQALAEGKPVIFGIAIFETFDDCSHSGGVVQMPAPADVPHVAHTLHAMCAVGYSDNEKIFIVRNSRGPDWGDGGYCYIPYAYVLNPRLNDGDCWVFVPKSSAQPPREAWSDDTKPVTNGGSGVDFPIETQTIEDYANVAVDLFEPERRPYHHEVDDDYARYVALAARGEWHEMQAFDAHAALSEAADEPHF